MKDNIINDLVIYKSIEILKGNIKIEYNKEDDKWLKEFYIEKPKEKTYTLKERLKCL